ncbi:quercetin 2,3-dioxygenase [Altererythrobacter sp. B11]|uniref:pirin family protein n=1 Tax=Altererythrobacter sp. B11 TaxID=2060312 RepID=UPI000DC72F60|nr:pirin family protein [Altererythrobacter sp. B11]BBC71801.1 quercetin 2,3-dioxygenase [Altererythrobacter sp. B11]
MTSNPTTTRSRVRGVKLVSRGEAASDGAGVRLTRMLGNRDLPQLDPFLMLDQIRSDARDDYIAGFPEHPHRGFETVTIMIDGAMKHGDNKGHSGVIEAGGIQWMTAGRGILHSEMPVMEDGRLWGFQLWINLPAASKMVEPSYQEFSAAGIPHVDFTGGTVRVLAGTLSSGLEGPARSAATDPLLLDITLAPGATFEEPLPADRNAILAVYQGQVEVAGTAVHDPDLAVLDEGDLVRVVAGAEGARLLLIAARPLNEPVARYGPFVMNTPQEIQQAFADFQSGRF